MGFKENGRMNDCIKMKADELSRKLNQQIDEKIVERIVELFHEGILNLSVSAPKFERTGDIVNADQKLWLRFKGDEAYYELKERYDELKGRMEGLEK